MVAGYNQQRYADPPITRRTNAPVDAFAEARTVSLYQYVDDVVIGTGRDQNGEIYDMTIPIAIDLYHSPEFGGVQQKYSMADWKSTNKEIVMRGWFYQGRSISRATKDGREFASFMMDCMRTIEEAVNEHFSPIAPETVTKVVVPVWAWLTLFTTVILIVLLMLSLRF